MLPASFAGVFGALVTAGLIEGLGEGLTINLIKSGGIGQLTAADRFRDLFPRRDLPWYQCAIS
jgi:hypothetical protein